MSKGKLFVIGPGDPWGIEDLAEQLERRRWIGGNDTPYTVTDAPADNVHIAKARVWIERAKERIHPDTKALPSNDAWKFLNEALVELALAVGEEVE
jgi:hypothetical protein